MAVWKNNNGDPMKTCYTYKPEVHTSDGAKELWIAVVIAVVMLILMFILIDPAVPIV